MSVFRAFCLRSRNGILTHIQSQPSRIKVLQPLFYKLRNDVHFKHLAGSTSTIPQKAPKKTPSPYDSMIRKKRDEAERSILVQVQSAMSHPELYSYISQFASVEQMYHYSFSDDMQFIVVELSSAEDVERILDASGHLSQGDLIPVRSPLLWFRAKGGGNSLKSKSKKKSKNIENAENLPPLKCGCITLSEGDIMKSVSSCSSFSEQVQVLYKLSCLDELGSRIRFLTARQLELALQGIFPNAKAIPFGSSVNGFGRVGCDLDLSLHLDSCESEEEDGNPTSLRLIFQTKMIPFNGRAQMQRQMEAVGDILQLFLPGCTHVRRILQARVPIVKYHQDFTSLECDVTMSNQTAVFMSELLWIMGSLDARVRPLVFTVRHWAKAVRLTSATPGPFITNFTLTLLVLHYLQCCKPHPVLPSLTTLISMAAPGDRRVSDDGVNCTFLRDISRVKPSENTESLHALLFGFFQFYASFNFEGRGLSLAKGHGDNSGVGIVKPDASPLYVENPLERMLNVSKNVNGQELERLRIEMRSAAWLMEEMLALSDDEAQEVHSTRTSHSALKSASDGALSWGLMDLLSPSNAKVKDNRLSVGTAMKINAKGRLVRVTDLFEDTERDDSRASHSVTRGAHKGRKR
ncbi:poly(A) RNA polymerase, mitochondrial-like [Ischnura elegans]|uniref:poly(A) RNA polymerase, mitochondrial-like n=1 Tax=Ischnura elegans TaxID=197161 RepID=UPI001ED88404|nr:poly(A) RNA polymerase, mitochondrial-like [Ischnura elegans]